MNQSSTPLFRNCPNQEIFEDVLDCDCRNCEQYERCIEIKARRRQSVRKNRKIISKGNVSSKNVQLIPKKVKNANTQKYKIIVLMMFVIVFVLIGIFTSDGYDDLIISESDYAIPEIVKTVPENEIVEEIETEENSKSTLHEEKEEVVLKDEKDEIEETISEESNEVKEQIENVIPTISAYEPSLGYYYNLSSEEKKELEKLVYKEARGESYEGKVAVVAVVLNRYVSNDSRFDTNSIHSVITQTSAFASISDVTQADLDSVSDLKDAVEDACRGWDPTRKKFPNGALFFYAPAEVKGYQAQIREGIEVLQIGNHNFHVDLND